MAQMSLNDLMELCRHLKQEKLFVNAEKDQLMSLHTSATATAEQLYQKSWIARQQKTVLNKLVLASGDTTPAACCLKVNAVESAQFIDGYRQLTYHETKIGRFLKQLRESPRLVALCLIHAEGAGSDNVQELANIIVSGLYGNIVMPDDENFALQVVRHLIDCQVVHCEDPRRLLRRGSCAFSVMYRLLTESLFSARLYLTAALHKPVIQLLMEDEWFYDIDPARALHRFPAAERQRRFGAPGTPEYESKTREYRELITDKLVTLVERFISSLQANMYCFPSSLAWVVSHLYHTLTKVGRTPPLDAQAICADLVVTYFVCPAVCDPEPYGITSDAPIGYIARHNLMQVGQILQVLAVTSSSSSSNHVTGARGTNSAMNDFSSAAASGNVVEEFNGRTKDLFNKFTKGCMSFLLDGLLDAPSSSPMPPVSGSQLSGFSRAAAIMSSAELVKLADLVYSILETLDASGSDRTALEDLVVSSGLPPMSVLQSLCGGNASENGGRNIPTQSSSARSSPSGTPLGTPPIGSGRKSGRS